MSEVKTIIEVKINPTESEDKIKDIIKNIFGDETSIQIKPLPIGAQLIVKVKTLEKFRDLIKREQIRNAARKIFFEGLNKKIITFYLNKQVASVGHISFSNAVAESPLGSVKVQINSENPLEFIDWLTSSKL
jgi:predicted RNA binding protein with dsRBD fold (UPF0201 family)